MWNDFTAQPGFRRWFEWNVRDTIRQVRFNEKNDFWLREALTEKEVAKCVVSHFAERAESFISPGNWAWLSDLEMDGDCHIEYDQDAVLRRIPKATEKAQKAIEVQRDAQRAERDAQNYSDLDQWLEALDTGKLESGGPSEPDGEKLVDDRWAFRKAARRRYRYWPKSCRTCGAQFRPKPANVKSCEPCLVEMRANRQAKRKAAKA